MEYTNVIIDNLNELEKDIINLNQNKIIIDGLLCEYRKLSLLMKDDIIKSISKETILDLIDLDGSLYQYIEIDLSKINSTESLKDFIKTIIKKIFEYIVLIFKKSISIIKNIFKWLSNFFLSLFNISSQITKTRDLLSDKSQLEPYYKKDIQQLESFNTENKNENSLQLNNKPSNLPNIFSNNDLYFKIIDGVTLIVENSKINNDTLREFYKSSQVTNNKFKNFIIFYNKYINEVSMKLEVNQKSIELSFLSSRFDTYTSGMYNNNYINFIFLSMIYDVFMLRNSNIIAKVIENGNSSSSEILNYIRYVLGISETLIDYIVNYFKKENYDINTINQISKLSIYINKQFKSTLKNISNREYPILSKFINDYSYKFCNSEGLLKYLSKLSSYSIVNEDIKNILNPVIFHLNDLSSLLVKNNNKKIYDNSTIRKILKISSKGLIIDTLFKDIDLDDIPDELENRIDTISKLLENTKNLSIPNDEINKDIDEIKNKISKIEQLRDSIINQNNENNQQLSLINESIKVIDTYINIQQNLILNYLKVMKNISSSILINSLFDINISLIMFGSTNLIQKLSKLSIRSYLFNGLSLYQYLYNSYILLSV